MWTIWPVKRNVTVVRDVRKHKKDGNMRLSDEIVYDKKTPEEKQQIFRMYQEIFQDPEPFADYYFQYCYRKNRVLKLVREGNPASMLHLNPYILNWQGKQYPVSYIVAVATDSRYRRQGLMAKLLNRAFQDLYEEGQLFTYLIPAKEAYYTPFDFTYVMNWQEVKGDQNGKAVGRVEQDNVWNIEKIVPSMYEEAAEWLNQKRGEFFDLWIQAGESYIEQQDAEMQSESGGLYFLCRNGEKLGFFSAGIEEDTLFCTNVWLPEQIDEDTLEKILFQYFHKKKIEVIFPGQNPSGFFYCESVPKIMVRMICLEKFLERMRADQEISIVLEVEDTFVPENNGCFFWRAGREGSYVEKLENQSGWKIGIRRLTGILFGYGKWEDEIADAPEEVRKFFHHLSKLSNISITEQV